MSAAASKEANAAKQEAAKLQSHYASSPGNASPVGQKGGEEAPYLEIDVEIEDAEQRSPEKPYKLIKVSS